MTDLLFETRASIGTIHHAQRLSNGTWDPPNTRSVNSSSAFKIINITVSNEHYYFVVAKLVRLYFTLLLWVGERTTRIRG